MDRAGSESDRMHIEIVDLLTQKVQLLTSHIDKSVTDFRWLNQTHILLTVIEVGYGVLYSIDATHTDSSLVLQFKHELLTATVPLSIPTSDSLVA